MSLHSKSIDSPVGRLKLVANDRGLVAILWPNDSPHRVRLAAHTENTRHPILTKTEAQLAEYFACKRQQFDLPLDRQGTTFQRAVWNALLAIPRSLEAIR